MYAKSWAALTCQLISLLFFTAFSPSGRAQTPADLCIQDGGTAQCTGVRQEAPVYSFRTGPGVGEYSSEGALRDAVDTWLASFGHCSYQVQAPTYSWGAPSVGPTQVTWYGDVPYSIDVANPDCNSPYTYHLVAEANKAVQVSCPQGYNLGSQSLSSQYPHGYCYRPVVQRCQEGQKDPCAGNPINVSDGNKIQVEEDYPGTQDGLLKFRRTYNAFGGYVHPGSQFYSAGGGLGRSWTHTYERKLFFLASGQAIVVIRPDGNPLWFRNVSGNYQKVGTALDKLVSNGSSGWKYTDENDNTEFYDTAGVLQSIVARNGQSVTLTYSNSSTSTSIAPAPGFLILVTDNFGHQLRFTYGAWGQITTMTDPAGGIFQYAYDGTKAHNENNLLSVTFPDSASRSYSYSTGVASQSFVNNLTGITDENSVAFASWGYNLQGQATSSEHAGGAGYVDVAVSSGQTTVTDALGTYRYYYFQTINDVIKNTDVWEPDSTGSMSAHTQYGYDANGNISQKTDPRGVITSYTYDLTRNLETSRVEAYGAAEERTIATNWHSTFRLPTLITEPNRTTGYTYDSNGNVLTKTITDTSVTPNVSRTWAYTYNSYGKVLTEIGPRTDVTDVTTYTYYSCTTGDECGQVETITNALNQTKTFDTYNGHGQPLQITDSNGVVTTLSYDLGQRLTARTTVGETTTFTYWPTGLLKKVTLPDDSFLEYSYDNAHRLVQIEDDEGDRIEYTLDAMGNRTSEDVYDVSNALARTRTQVFNGLNQLWKQIGSANTGAVTTAFGYDNNGNQTSIVAPLSRNTANGYDPLNRLIEITDPGSGTTAFAYDDNDNLTSVTDPRSLVTSYEYNGFGEVIELDSPDTGTSTSTYDSGGNLATRTDARSKIGTYAYDTLNRVTSVTYPDQTVSFTYDAGTYGEGHLTGASDANHSLAWTYDALGRVTGKGQTVGGITKSVGYGYTDGNQTSLVTPSGQTITYGYANGRITSVTLNGSTTILNNVLYEPFGPVRGWTWGNSTAAVRTHNQDGLITAIDSEGATSYTYDDAFRITDIDDLDDSSRNWSFAYDALDRLDYAAKSGLTLGYTYDANGNRLSQSGTQSATYTVSGSNNRISSITGTPARTYAYDATGNTTGYGSLSYTYSDAGRMSSATVSSNTTSYLYNAVGQRVKKSNASITRYYVYDEGGHLIGEYDGSGGLVQETVWLGNIPVATLRPNGGGVSVFYVHSDHLNSPKRISRPSDNVVVWRWDTAPFGNTATNEDPDADSTLMTYNLRFPGQYYDSETGLAQNWYRDYDASTARYAESDPIGLNGGINTYLYANGNPILLYDPLGLAAMCGSNECVQACRRAHELAVQKDLQNYLDAVSECRKGIAKKGMTSTDCIIGEAIFHEDAQRWTERQYNACLKTCVKVTVTMGEK